MLNVKKISIIKAAVFGLVLSNAGIAAQAGAGESVPGAAVAVPVASPFLKSLNIPAHLDNKAATEEIMSIRYKVSLATNMLVRARESEGKQKVLLQQVADKDFQDIPTSPTDKEILCILHPKVFGDYIYLDREAKKAIFTPMLRQVLPGMSDVEIHLWVLFFWESPLDDNLAVFRSAIKAYHDEILN